MEEQKDLLQLGRQRLTKVKSAHLHAKLVELGIKKKKFEVHL